MNDPRKWLALARRRQPVETAPAEPATPRFVCRTCAAEGPFYVAQQVTNWNAIGMPYRTPDGSLTYRTYPSYLPGEPGPALAYLCGNCRARAGTIEELVLEPGLLEQHA